MVSRGSCRWGPALIYLCLSASWQLLSALDAPVAISCRLPATATARSADVGEPWSSRVLRLPCGSGGALALRGGGSEGGSAEGMSWAQRAKSPKAPAGAVAVGEVQGQEGSPADEGNRGGAFTDTQVSRRGDRPRCQRTGGKGRAGVEVSEGGG